ncbi:MAG: thioredoxin [Clostridia bacterium]|jgi:thioredoxin 1|nr:thioredoxin [Clostridia bacterium]
MAEMNITSSNFEELVLRSEKPVLLDFWATWCGPCLMLAPTIEKIAKEHSEIAVGKVNVDDDPSLAIRFGISSIPTLLVFKNGELADKSIGVVSEEKILQMLGI